jgi:hypothetical protein
MKHKLFDTFGIVILGLMGVTAGAANAQTTAPGPYYPNPSWNQKLQCDTQETCPRFTVLSDWGGAAVPTLRTGLVWEKSPTPVTGDWFSSQDRCTSLTKGGRLGWRLPRSRSLSAWWIRIRRRLLLASSSRRQSLWVCTVLSLVSYYLLRI